jgi:class 3 adenylate cyclase
VFLIRVPTLILHRQGSGNIRVEAGRHLAGRISGAKYVELEGQDYSIVESLSQRDTPVRAGLHTGECEFAAGELVGAAVQIAESVLRTATWNEVLVSSTARDLVAGSAFQYAEGRQCAIEGISRRWDVFPLQRLVWFSRQMGQSP